MRFFQLSLNIPKIIKGKVGYLGQWWIGNLGKGYRRQWGVEKPGSRTGV